MKKTFLTILAIIFLFATILMGLIFSGKIELNENWTFVLSVVQIISWLGYTNLSELEKRYKIVISAFTIVAVCIIGLFYFLKVNWKTKFQLPYASDWNLLLQGYGVELTSPNIPAWY